ncbi:Succinate dehydrogenase assembly factor 3, mitochondrial [Pseudocercospora fuligena]|uniref:Succinate dehydrogenase assembly factor 3 n=1 Tax=Pseudocercospora fuligena TaxID=685502 RepID=A0A8H6VMX5_9PEZI|nr:Succinate dehydrogenase assembly factor 3, mitochondrial [Pseudocercospora fuligena]
MPLRSYATPSSIGTQSHGLKGSQIALLPPIPLYRRILRAHRKFLPREMRVLGDEYVKAEFRAHRDTENPVHIVGFLTEWQGYAQQVEGDKWRGEKMDVGKVDKMSDEQLAQMYELMQAIRKSELEENDPEYQHGKAPEPPSSNEGKGR